MDYYNVTSIEYDYEPKVGDMVRITFDDMVFERQVKYDQYPYISVELSEDNENPPSVLLTCTWNQGYIDIDTDFEGLSHSIKIEVFKLKPISDFALSPIYYETYLCGIVSALNYLSDDTEAGIVFSQEPVDPIA